MKKLLLALFLGLLTFTAVHAQQTVVIERHGIFTDLASAAGAIVTMPLAAVEGIVIGTTEAAGSLIHGSTQIVVTPPAIVTSPPATIPTTTTIITTHGDGTVTTVTRQASAYEHGPVVLMPVDPNHRVGTSPHVNPYVYRYR